ncbi:type III secretion system LEE translocon pore-forming subunit EspB [Escherichia coli]|uniref:type III secretion system LEE translocon pore-forming subunit EspB n=1 Tax=Escherichia coli TaxID=562 RepID=UPI0006A237C2|nr:type III secretion system LEE translocon pore-forming subunit EspB [Escherichia coli]EAA2293206.1 type III secretion system LEE translocon pore-forming subunit EspB [Escherichia coli]EFH3427396.1 type III secretion system LEE translocon pore-forming subunit EspB [Escherichia coli]EFK0627877.1 type III secretion system LEE translocon pore-forming subunit EspB [Escherichia coli]EFK3191232.1 type III secretion system LEE translocon pore-forming subunit EspB [Escherichia coli]EGE4321808.1 type 
MNTIDNTQVTMVNSASESTTGASSAVAASALSIDSSLLTDGKVDICKLMLEIQKLLDKMVTLLQDYQQKQLAQSYQIQQAVFESQNKAIEEKKAAATAALVGGIISSALGILGSFAAMNNAAKGAGEIAEKASSASSKAAGAASEVANKALVKATESVADVAEEASSAMQKAMATTTKAASRASGVADDVAKASDVAEDLADAAEKTSRINKLLNAVDKLTNTTAFVAVTSLAEGTKTLPTTISESVKSTHEVNEQRAKSLENFQQGNLELYKQDVRRTQDDITTRLRDITSAVRDLLEVQNRMGQSGRLAG